MIEPVHRDVIIRAGERGSSRICARCAHETIPGTSEVSPSWTKTTTASSKCAVIAFLRGWAARDEPRRPDDNTAPGHILCGIAERTGDRLLLDAARRLADHLAQRRRIAGVTVTFEDARRSLREPYGAGGLASEQVGPTDNSGR